MATIVCLLTCGCPLAADEPKPIELTLHPRAIETPVLKYRLLPSEAELKPGNAVPILLRLPWDQRPWMNQEFPKLDEWNQIPLNSPDWATSKGVLPDNFYRELKRAAYRRDAYWEYPIHELSNPYMVLLPDAQDLRGFIARGLSGRIRYHISRGELDEAREGILVGFANSRHMAQTPFYILQMVARAHHMTMLARVEELISQPDSPNLYWALSSLPNSLLNMERAAGLESQLFALAFPAVHDFDFPRNESEWNTMAGQLVAFLEEMDELPQQPSGAENSVEVFLAKVIDQARADLPELTGIPEDKVEMMCAAEVGVRWYAHVRMSFDQHVAAVLALLPREALPELRKLQAEVAVLRGKTGTNLNFPEAIQLYANEWSLKRKVQALRIVEAVRHYRDTRDGRFPAALDEIRDVTIPVDPLTDQPFDWSVENNVATLKTPPLPADLFVPGSGPYISCTMEYRLRAK